MAKPAVTVEFRGVKCDASGCDYKDETADPLTFEIGTPCPICGASLLTEDDWRAMRLLIGAAELVNAEFGPVPDDSKGIAIPVEMDGTGKLEFPVEFPDA